MELRETYNKIAEDWHEDHKHDTWWVAGTDEFISLLAPGSHVLDVGCAGGVKTRYLQERGMQVTGIDFSEAMISIAKQEVPGAEFFVHDVQDIESFPGVFDAVFVQAVLLHVPKKDIPRVFKRLASKVRPGGYVYVAVKEQRAGGVAEEMKVEDDYGYTYERFFSYFTQEEIEGYMRAVGLTIRSTRRTEAGHTVWIQVIGRRI